MRPAELGGERLVARMDRHADSEEDFEETTGHWMGRALERFAEHAGAALANGAGFGVPARDT